MKWFEDDSRIISDEVMAMSKEQVKAEIAKYMEEINKQKLLHGQQNNPKPLNA
jgi:hypothetical protein